MDRTYSLNEFAARLGRQMDSIVPAGTVMGSSITESSEHIVQTPSKLTATLTNFNDLALELFEMQFELNPA